MRKIEVLRNCTTQRDLARILGYPERKFTQILFTQNVIHQYKKFEISKKSGGLRTIYAPKDELKELQRRLSTYLQDCHKEIELHRLSNHQQISIKSFSSFAFRPKIKLELSNRILHFDIYNHALKHTNKKFVLNLDLENFFETITFSRIVGYFIKNESFLLEKDIAILIAQICTIRASQNEEGFLPQGSPTSPVISNLIANILDIKILRLAQKHKINYSRYADDITLSTNMREFPREIAYKSDDKWVIGNKLESIIIQSRFKINNRKTRLYFRNNRQEVTSLTVNKKVNINRNYYRYTRAMVNNYCRDGEYFKSNFHMDSEKVSENTLNGILSFIFYVKKNNYDFSVDTKAKNFEDLESIEKLYVKFLFHYYLVYPKKTLVLGEGFTDPLHLKIAFKNLYPNLQQNISFSYLGYTKRFSALMRYKGGTGLIVKFIENYLKIFKAKKLSLNPLIILVDGDKAGNDVIRKINKDFKDSKKEIILNFLPKQDIKKFIHAYHNLYIIQLPNNNAIEDLYPSEILEMKIGERRFSKENEFNRTKYFGKHEFYNEIVSKNINNHTFNGFNQISVILNYIQLYHLIHWMRQEVLD